MEKLGIENLKVAIVAAINLGEKIEKNLADDGKITLIEAFGIGASSFGDVVKVIRSGNDILDEYNDLEDDEWTELVELVKDELDLENDRLEEIIEKAVEFLSQLDDLVSSLRD